MTTITDDFNRANADALGSSSEGWSWTEVAGDNDIQGNTFYSGTNGTNYARAESDLATDDHYAQADCTTLGVVSGGAVAVAVRYSPSANTCYLFYVRQDASNYRLFKNIAGSWTQIGTTLAESVPATPFTVRLEVDGSDLTAKINGTTKRTGTDSAITGNKRTGLITGIVSSVANAFDDFEAADLGGVGATIPVFYHHYRQMS